MPRNRVLSILQEPRHRSSAKGLYVARFAFGLQLQVYLPSLGPGATHTRITINATYSG